MKVPAEILDNIRRAATRITESYDSIGHPDQLPLAMQIMYGRAQFIIEQLDVFAGTATVNGRPGVGATPDVLDAWLIEMLDGRSSVQGLSILKTALRLVVALDPAASLEPLQSVAAMVRKVYGQQKAAGG